MCSDRDEFHTSGLEFASTRRLTVSGKTVLAAMTVSKDESGFVPTLRDASGRPNGVVV
jgi:hypothetical protein